VTSPYFHAASWRWINAPVAVAFTFLVLLAASLSHSGQPAAGLVAWSDPAASGTGGSASPALSRVAAAHPRKRLEVIVQLERSTGNASGKALIQSQGGHVTRDLEIINGFGVEIEAAKAVSLATEPGVRSVSLNSAIEKAGSVFKADDLSTAYNGSIQSQKAWDPGFTGKGVGVAVIDTGIAGDVPDFRVSQSDPASRVVASAVVNPSASSASDGLGHGTHIAGLIAGNGRNRQASDPTFGDYVGVAPEANLIAVKAGDEHGVATVLDVIDGLQFVVDHKQDYNIRIVNLSLRSTSRESYKTDPLDAAVESAWFNGIAVIVAAGNSGTDQDAVSYAPANDPYVITVGGVDDRGTKGTSDDSVASWSSRGVTQDGLVKPDVLAPGAHLVSTLAPGSDYTSLCPQCVTDGAYFKVGGTSMAAGVVSGAIADVIQAHPDWTPDQIKGTLTKADRGRTINKVTTSAGQTVDGQQINPADLGSISSTTIIGREIALDKVIPLKKADPPANVNLTQNSLVDPATGLIDYTRASWSRASWSDAADPLRASWSRASWSRASWSRASWSATPQSCSDFERASWSRASWSDADIQAAKDACTQMDPTRASWSGADFTRASWSTSFYK
jgi:serine protease AprX